MFEPSQSSETVTEKSPAGNILRCEFQPGKGPILTKRIPEGLLRDAIGMRFRARADSHRQLCLTIATTDEDDRYQFVSVGKHWQVIDIRFDDMQRRSNVDPSSTWKSGSIERITLTDRNPSATRGVLRIADWSFHRTHQR